MKLATDNSWPKWTLLLALALSAKSGAGQSAVLLTTANVSRDTIRLSDLLPPQASSEMRRAGEQIEMGRTPLCHTVRVFDPHEVERRASSWPALQGMTVSGPASVQRACFPIRHEAVRRVISEFVERQGVSLAESPLHWPGVIYASHEDPALEIEKVLPDSARQELQVRVRCLDRTVCPSFWVAVPTTRPLHPSSAAPVSVVPTAPPIAQSTALVESGQRVMLVFDDPRMQIQLPVTCLQRGWLGKRVRAMDPFTHHIFLAEVAGAGTLRAPL